MHVTLTGCCKLEECQDKAKGEREIQSISFLCQKAWLPIVMGTAHCLAGLDHTCKDRFNDAKNERT